MKKYLVLLVLCVFVGGCSVYLSPAYKAELSMQRAYIDSLAEKCVEDCNACQKGLLLAAETLELILDASNGVSNGQD